MSWLKKKLFNPSLDLMRRMTRLIAISAIFTAFFVCGVVISIVEGALLYDNFGFVYFSPLLICSIALTVLSAFIVAISFSKKVWKIQEFNSSEVSLEEGLRLLIRILKSEGAESPGVPPATPGMKTEISHKPESPIEKSL